MSSTELSERLEREYRASASAAREPYDWEAEGTFDDCQDHVKALFADVTFRDRRNLGAVGQ